MKNITVSVDEPTYRRAKVKAAELDTSVSALVRDFLRKLSNSRDGEPFFNQYSSETESERRTRLLSAVLKDIRATRPGFSAADNVPRDDLYRSREIR